MVQTTLLIQANKDLLSRAAANIAQDLKTIESSIYFRSFGRQANAKSLVGLLTLGIRQGESFEVFIISKNDIDAALDLERILAILDPYSTLILAE